MPEGTVLAFDFGLKRVGVAVGNRELRIAHPLETLSAADRETLLKAIDVLVKEWQPSLLVVGDPKHEDGRPHELAQHVRRFMAELVTRSKIPTILCDESFSSAVASMTLRAAGVSGRKQKTMLDSVAAQEILQGYFDNQVHHGATQH
jgi:putative holliday junction resolvase